MESCQAMADGSINMVTMLETGKMTDSMAKEQYIFNLGTCVLSDGRTQVGAFTDSNMHGQGKLTNADGTVV